MPVLLVYLRSLRLDLFHLLPDELNIEVLDELFLGCESRVAWRNLDFQLELLHLVLVFRYVKKILAIIGATA